MNWLTIKAKISMIEDLSIQHMSLFYFNQNSKIFQLFKAAGEEKLISRFKSHLEMRSTTVLIVLLGAQLAYCQVNLALNRPTSQVSLNSN